LIPEEGGGAKENGGDFSSEAGAEEGEEFVTDPVSLMMGVEVCGILPPRK
jgi:hypothetical protein